MGECTRIKTIFGVDTLSEEAIRQEFLERYELREGDLDGIYRSLEEELGLSQGSVTRDTFKNKWPAYVSRKQLEFTLLHYAY